MCWAYNRQYGTRFLAVMPTNLYGPGDNYDLRTLHVLPALIRKMAEAKERRDAEVVLWGTGTPKREFLYSDDMADACVFLMNLPDGEFATLVSSQEQPPLINIGRGEDQTIREIATTVAEVVGFCGKLVFDPAMPDGTPRKLLDVSRLAHFGWLPRVPLRLGLELAYEAFRRERGAHDSDATASST